MGSAFLKGRELGPLAGNGNSTVGRAMVNDPVSKFLFGAPKYVTPTAGPWAGVAPSLAAANSGYGLNATGNPQLNGGGVSPQLSATFAQRPATMPIQQPAQRPVMGAQNPGQGFVNASQQFANRPVM